jgi:biotin transport system ATP-binding protein
MLEARNINLSISGISILMEISAAFSPGEIAILTGPNGSGKSRFLHCLSGLSSPDSGTVLLDGEEYPRRGQSLGTGVGLVFQQPEMQVIEQTVEQDILFGLKNLEIDGDERRSRLEDALAWSALEAHRHQNPATLSGGEIRRLALASVMAMNPRFVLLDEPFENLDYPGVVETLEQILKIRERGCGVVIVTHGLEKCLAHADRLILMKAGRIIADALPERVLPHLEDHDVRRPGMKIRDMTWLRS